MIEIGDISITSLSDGTFMLDGGAMFGVVPRALWEKTNPPDGQNRILLALNPLLIQARGMNILVETGIGDKWDEKFRRIYAIERTRHLSGSIRKIGLEKKDVSVVINTHLHFDHAGGNTAYGTDGLVPAFPNARYIVQRGEIEAALKPNERTRASYREDDCVPVMDCGLFDLLDGDEEIVKGVSVLRTPGHNRDIQLVKVTSGNSTAVFLSDVIPTAAHLKAPYIAGYDLFPLETLERKKELVERAAAEKWLLVFFHDPAATAGYVRIEGNTPLFERIS